MKLLPAFLLTAVILGAGCTSSTTTTTSTSTPARVSVSETDNGRVVTAKKGDTVEVVLHSTYWQFDALNSVVVKSTGEAVVAPELAGHIPGSGAGTVTEDFVVEESGTANISASRTTCGEALQCTGDQGSFSVTIKAE